MKAYITRLIPAEGLDMVRRYCDVEVWEGELSPPYELLLEKVRDIDGLLSLLTDRVDASLMDAAPKLRVISNYAVGYDNIDVAAATQRGIIVGHTPGVLTEAVADFTMALLLAAGRRVVEGERFVKAGRWKAWGPTLFLGRDIHGATLGLVGLGRIGGGVARRARGFAMRILYHDIARREDLERELGLIYTDFETLLRESDFVSLHVPLTEDTHHLMSKEQFALMKPTAILINTSRGPVVDQRALYEALRSGKIAGAALDVTDPEPIAPDDPLLSLDNCLIVPHMASASIATRTKMATMAAENLIAGLRGEMPPHPVNPEVLRR